MQPLMYSTVSKTPSSPCPPIGTIPTSPEPKEVGASSTGKEPTSVCWMALVLYVCACMCMHECVCVRVCVRACVCVSVGLHGVPYAHIGK